MQSNKKSKKKKNEACTKIRATIFSRVQARKLSVLRTNQRKQSGPGATGVKVAVKVPESSSVVVLPLASTYY